MKTKNHGLSEKEMELVQYLIADCESTGDIRWKILKTTTLSPLPFTVLSHSLHRAASQRYSLWLYFQFCQFLMIYMFTQFLN